MGTSNENRRVGCNRADDPEIHRQRPPSVRQRDGRRKLQHKLEGERERHDNNQYGNSERGYPARHANLGPNIFRGIHTRYGRNGSAPLEASGSSRWLSRTSTAILATASQPLPAYIRAATLSSAILSTKAQQSPGRRPKL